MAKKLCPASRRLTASGAAAVPSLGWPPPGVKPATGARPATNSRSLLPDFTPFTSLDLVRVKNRLRPTSAGGAMAGAVAAAATAAAAASGLPLSHPLNQAASPGDGGGGRMLDVSLTGSHPIAGDAAAARSQKLVLVAGHELSGTFSGMLHAHGSVGAGSGATSSSSDACAAATASQERPHPVVGRTGAATAAGSNYLQHRAAASSNATVAVAAATNTVAALPLLPGVRRRQRSISDSGCGGGGDGVWAFLAAADVGAVGLPLGGGLGVLGGDMFAKAGEAQQSRPNTCYVRPGDGDVVSGAAAALSDLSLTLEECSLQPSMAAVAVATADAAPPPAAQLAGQVTGAAAAAGASGQKRRRRQERAAKNGGGGDTVGPCGVVGGVAAGGERGQPAVKALAAGHAAAAAVAAGAAK